MTYELHPLCTLFPRLGEGEFSALVDDIKANGLREPITLHDGMILDGGNRYRACVAAGVVPTFSQFTGGNLVTFVLSANLHRRHLSAGQQAAIVASAQDWAKAQTRGGDRRSAQSATLHLDSADKRAAESGASLRTQKMADKVAKADPVLAKKVAHGEVSLPKAHRVVSGKDSEPAERIPEVVPDLGEPDDDEIAEAEAQMRADSQTLAFLLDADDKLKAAAEEIIKLKAQVRLLAERNAGLVAEKNEAVKAAKRWKEKFDKAQMAMQ